MNNRKLMLTMAVLIGAGSLTGVANTALAADASSDSRGADAVASQNKAIVSAAFDRWAAGGSNFFAEMLTPDVVWTIEGSGPSAATYRGLEPLIAQAVRPLVSRLSTPVRPTAKRLWAEGEHVIVNWSGSATARDGKPYHNDYVWILRMRQGKAFEVTAFLDLAAYDDVLRRIPVPPSEGPGR